MRIFVLGTVADVRGFALAGLEGRVADDSRGIRHFLEELGENRQNVGLLLVSESIARSARGALQRLTRSGSPPAVLILPEAHQ